MIAVTVADNLSQYKRRADVQIEKRTTFEKVISRREKQIVCKNFKSI